MNYDIELVHKGDIKVGDVIICEDGIMRTVSRNNITRDSFMGLCIFGSSYKLGYQKIKKVIIKTSQ